MSKRATSLKQIDKQLKKVASKGGKVDICQITFEDGFVYKTGDLADVIDSKAIFVFRISFSE